jgi:hypothetical protein
MKDQSSYIVGFEGPVEFTSYTSHKVIRLYELANRLSWSEEQVVRALREGGYDVPLDAPAFYLEDKHIDYLSHVYVKAIKETQQYLLTKKLDPIRKRNVQAFFRKFIKPEILETEGEEVETRIPAKNKVLADLQALYQALGQVIFLDSQPDCLSLPLDDELIRNFFLSIAYSVNSYSLRGLKAIFIEIQYRIKLVFMAAHRNVLSFVQAHRYHIFASDDEDSKEANTLTVASLQC